MRALPPKPSHPSLQKLLLLLGFSICFMGLPIPSITSILTLKEASARPKYRRKARKARKRYRHPRRIARLSAYERRLIYKASRKKTRRYRKHRRAHRKVRRTHRRSRRRTRLHRNRWYRRFSRRLRYTRRAPLAYPPGGQRTAFCGRLLRREEALRYVQTRHPLQHSLRRYIGHLRSCGWLRPRDYARVLVYDHRGCKLVGIQDRTVTSAASLIKPFVMFAAYEKAHRKGIAPQRFPLSLQNQVNRMMRISSNSATNHMIRYVGDGDARRGLHRINRLIRRFGMKQTRLVELIPRNGRTYRNTTTARDLSTLLSMIYRRRAVSSAYSRLMMHVMLHSRDNRGRTPYLRSHYHVTAATKTGYTRRTNGVAGIILSGKGLGHASYNLVAVVTRPAGATNEWIWKRTSSPIVRRISEMTYHYYTTGGARREVRLAKKRRTRVACAH